MGEKRLREGQHVYFCIACLIFLSLTSCALIKELRDREEARDSLLRGQALLAQGDYDGSLKENQKVLSLYPNRPPGGKALFNIGLVYAHVGNPKRDYRRALGFFRRLTSEYPQSPLVEQARIWIGVLQANEKLSQMLEKSKQVDIEIEEKKREKER